MSAIYYKHLKKHTMTPQDKVCEQHGKIEDEYIKQFMKMKLMDIPKYNLTERTESYDFSCISGATSTYIIAETKARTYNKNFFEQNGSMLEKTKLEGIQNRRKQIIQEHNIKPNIYYVTFTSDGYTMIYDLDSISDQTVWYQKWLQRSEFDKTKVLKWVTDLKKPIETTKLL